MAMTASVAFKVLNFPKGRGVLADFPEDGSINPDNLIRLTRRKLLLVSESNLILWEEAAAEGECLTAFKIVAGYLNRNSQPVDPTMFDSYTANPSKVRCLNVDEQIDLFGRSIKPVMNMSAYVARFECLCGSAHILNERISILREGMMKILALCPIDPSYIVTVKIKTFMGFKFQGLDTICGSRIRTHRERVQIGQLFTNLLT